MDEPKVETLILDIDPVLFNRLKLAHSFQKNAYNIEKKPEFNKWLVEYMLCGPLLDKEELRIANESFYNQKTIATEDINKPQIVRPPYVAPIPALLTNEDEFINDLAIKLEILDFKLQNKHIEWNCCSCYHCSEDEDEYDPDPCSCHQACVCWCDENHAFSHIFYKDGIKYYLVTETVKGKCPGHTICKERQ